MIIRRFLDAPLISQFPYRLIRQLVDVDRQDIENYVRFCQRPPQTWVAKKMVAKFLERDGQLVPNFEWRPYVAKVSKANHKLGKNPSAKRYRLSDSGLQAMLRILSTFYTFLEMEEHVVSNPSNASGNDPAWFVLNNARHRCDACLNFSGIISLKPLNRWLKLIQGMSGHCSLYPHSIGSTCEFPSSRIRIRGRQE